LGEQGEKLGVTLAKKNFVFKNWEERGTKSRGKTEEQDLFQTL